MERAHAMFTPFPIGYKIKKEGDQPFSFSILGFSLPLHTIAGYRFCMIQQFQFPSHFTILSLDIRSKIRIIITV